MSSATPDSSSLARSRKTWRSSHRVETVCHWARMVEILDFSDWRSLVLAGSFQMSGWASSESISARRFSRTGISKKPPHGDEPLADGRDPLLEVRYHRSLALAPALLNVNAAIMDSTAHERGMTGPNRT